MNKLEILVGISGSGKSTYTNELQREGIWRSLNRDKLREIMTGWIGNDISNYYSGGTMEGGNIVHAENIISDFIACMVKFSRNDVEGFVSDNTNLRMKYVNFYINLAENYNLQPIIKVIDTPLETCIQRDKNRDRTVGEEIIRKQYKQLQNLLSNTEFIKLQEKYS